MHRRLILVALLALPAVSTPADALSGPRPFLPLRLGTPASSMAARATDGTNFLVMANSTFGGPYAVIVAPDGTQLSQPVPLPGGFTVHWVGGSYLAFVSGGYVRITADGHLVDNAPLPFPGSFHYSVSNGRRLLCSITNQSTGAFLLSPDGTADPVELPAGTLLAVAGKDGRFLVSYRPAGSTTMHLRLLDDRGAMIRDMPYPGIAPVTTSDGFSWYAASSDGVMVSFLDDELKPIRTFPLGGTKLASTSPGRGYITKLVQRYLAQTGEATLLEFRAPNYDATVTYLPLMHSNDDGPYIWGNAHTLLVHGSTVSQFNSGAIGRIENLAQIRQTHPVLSLTMARERHDAAAATATDGTTLVTWNETTGVLGRRNLYAARITATGELIDTTPLLLVINECGLVRSRVTTDGANFLVAWHGCAQVGAEFVTAAGVHVPSFRTSRKGDDFLLGAHYDGSRFLLHWMSDFHTWVLGIQPNGTAITPARQIDFLSRAVAPRRGGKGFYILYRDVTQWKVAPLDDNLRIGDNGTVIPFDPGSTIFSFDDIGDRFLFTASRNNELRAMWLDENAQILGPIPASTFSIAGLSSPAIHCATQCTLLWNDPSAAPRRIHAAPILATPNNGVTLGDPVVLASSQPGQPVSIAHYFLGTTADPRMLIQSAHDIQEGGMQLFVHTRAKRRAARR